MRASRVRTRIGPSTRAVGLVHVTPSRLKAAVARRPRATCLASVGRRGTERTWVRTGRSVWLALAVLWTPARVPWQTSTSPTTHAPATGVTQIRESLTAPAFRDQSPKANAG